jgi:hypothetical protein
LAREASNYDISKAFFELKIANICHLGLVLEIQIIGGGGLGVDVRGVYNVCGVFLVCFTKERKSTNDTKVSSTAAAKE